MPVQTAKLLPENKTVHFGWKPATSEMKKRSVPLGPFLKKYGAKPPPAEVDYGAKAQAALAEMLGNDQAGDCVIAAELHGIGVWTANEPGGRARVPTTREALDQYRRICGPGDNGCYIPAVMDYQRDTGLTAGGTQTKIDGYVSVNPRDQLLMKYALWLFGRCNFGVNWPSGWMNLGPGFVLRPVVPNIVGGHSITGFGYDSTGVKVSTWGVTGTLSWDALADPRFVDECYVPLGPDWYNDDGLTASGVKVGALRDAMNVVASGGYPDIPDEPPAPPPAPVPGEWVFNLERNWHILGYTLHVHLGLKPADMMARAGAVDWWQLATALWRCYQAYSARDWAALATAALDVLRLLGIDVPGERAREIGAGIGKALEGLPGEQKAGKVDGGTGGDSPVPTP